MKTPRRTAVLWRCALVLGLASVVGCASVGLRSMRIYMQQQNWEKALEQGKIAVAENPNDADAWFAIAQVAAQVDSIDLMLEAMDRADSLTDKYDEDIAQIREAKYNEVFNRAVGRYNAGDLSAAEEQLHLATTIDSTRPYAYKVLGMIHHRKGEYGQALDMYSRAFSADTSDIGLGRQYAMLLNAAGQREKALAILGPIYEGHPGDKDVVMAYAGLLDDAGQTDSAIAVMKNALAQEPDDPDYNMRAGVLYMKKARAAEDSVELAEMLQQAMPYFERVVEKDSANVDAAYDLAMCYRQLDRADDALAVLNHILSINPNDHQARLQLALILLQQDKPEEAEPHLRQIIEGIGEPTNAEERMTISSAYRFLGAIYLYKSKQKEDEAQKIEDALQQAGRRVRRAEREAKERQIKQLREESLQLFREAKELDEKAKEYSGS